jgi:large subunit ribosomal protein L22
MEATAHLRFLTMAPRKLSVVAALVRGMPVASAISTLKWTRRAAALPVRKLIESAMANATDLSKGEVDVDKLWVKSIHVDQGPTSRRYMPRAMGRATRINKKTSHIHVIVTDAAIKKAKK